MLRRCYWRLFIQGIIRGTLPRKGTGHFPGKRGWGGGVVGQVGAQGEEEEEREKKKAPK